MTIGEYCNREVTISEPDTSIIEAAKLMRRHHVGDLVVVDRQEGKNLPVGIVTDRDLVLEVLAQDVDPDSLSIKDIMSTDLVTVLESETFLRVLDIMKKQRVRRILVVDDHGGLQGILSADDALELIAEAMNDLTGLVKREIAREADLRP
jgi:CBS domain-containing protein